MDKKKKPAENKDKAKTLLPFLAAALVITVLFNALINSYKASLQEEISYNDFISMVENGEVESVEIQPDRLMIKPAAGDGSNVVYFTGLVDDPELTGVLLENNVEFYRATTEQMSPFVSFLMAYVLPIVVMYLLFSLLMKSASKKMGGTMSFGQSRAKV